MLAGAVAGGVAGKLAERVTDFVADVIKGHDSAVQEQAAKNAAAFLAELGKQIELRASDRLSGDQMERALGDPDIASTIRTAVIGAARTSSKEKHDALARAVAERLASESESNEALASSLAVDAIPKLSGVHLRFLGIAAVAFVIRPLPDWYFEAEMDGNIRGRRAGRRYASFSEWLQGSLDHLHLRAELNQLEIPHLASTGRLTYERKLRRDLFGVLRPRLAEFDARSRVHYEVASDISEFLHINPIGKDLTRLWKYGLEHVTLTPAGVLIGAAVYESAGGDPVEVKWSRFDQPDDAVVQDIVWDGRDIREDFLSALDKAVKDRAERGVGPWRKLE